MPILSLAKFIQLGIITLLFIPMTGYAQIWKDMPHPSHVSYIDSKNPKSTDQRVGMVFEIGKNLGLSEYCTDVKSNHEMIQAYPEITELGLLGGIYLNTIRQVETDRNNFSIWSISNSSLTVDIYAYYEDFIDGRSCKDSPFIEHFGKTPAIWKGLSIDRVEVCEAWHTYFSEASEIAKQPWSIPGVWLTFNAQNSLWYAHTLSLFHVWVNHLDLYEEELNQKQVHQDEYSLWNAWNQVVVNILPTFNVSSCADQMWPHLDSAMPFCAFESSSPDQELQCQTRERDSDLAKESMITLVDLFIKGHRNTELSRAIDRAWRHIRTYQK